IPLTDLGPLGSLNIGSMVAIKSPDGDPNKTMIIAGTGISFNIPLGASGAYVNTATDNGSTIVNAGIGFLRSIDGGRTWQVIDSSNNNVTVNPTTGVQTALPISSTLRNHLFSANGTFVNRVVADPTPVNGKYILYAAITTRGTNAQASGLFRST